MFYEKDWLLGLVQKFKETGDIICYRGHSISLDEQRNILPYKSWGVYGENEDGICQKSLIMPTGIAGVLYPNG